MFTDLDIVLVYWSWHCTCLMTLTLYFFTDLDTVLTLTLFLFTDLDTLLVYWPWHCIFIMALTLYMFTDLDIVLLPGLGDFDRHPHQHKPRQDDVKNDATERWCQRYRDVTHSYSRFLRLVMLVVFEYWFLRILLVAAEFWTLSNNGLLCPQTYCGLAEQEKKWTNVAESLNRWTFLEQVRA